MKIKVKRKQNGRGDTFYQSAEKDHKGIYREFSDKEYNSCPEKFEVVGGLKESQRVFIHEKTRFTGNEMSKLPKPLGELNEVIALLAPFRPRKSRDEIVKEAETMLVDKKEYLSQRQLKESWQLRGLTPEAAESAATVESRNRPVDLPPATEWAGLLDKAYRRR
jgi:hypothetical protein